MAIEAPGTGFKNRGTLIAPCSHNGGNADLVHHPIHEFGLNKDPLQQRPVIVAASHATASHNGCSGFAIAWLHFRPLPA